VRDDYRPSWDLGNTWLGEPTINDGRVFLEGTNDLAPGTMGCARIEPLAPEFWGRVREGVVLPMQEGPRVVGYARVLEVVSRPDYWSPEVALFVDQVRQFCDFVEKAGEYSLAKRLSTARQRLLALYETAAVLPEVEPPDGVNAPRTSARPTQWPGFESSDPYWEVFDPYEKSEPVGGSLTDDLLDIYDDLRRGLALWDADGVTKIAAIWQWRFHFEIHWGDHAIDALRALHRACRAM
jgi:hypothetical protein